MTVYNMYCDLLLAPKVKVQVKAQGASSLNKWAFLMMFSTQHQ